jgi:NAD(P)-dependent dehydrogenase (short-subunit alcohol dehydrogenase family)
MGVVLITGCSSGFGLETALAFARRGDTVFATMRDTTKASALRRAADAERLALEITALDVTDTGSVQRAVAGILERTGGIDVLVNNAGIGARAAVETFPDEVVRAVFETNVFGVLGMLRAVLPGMRERRRGAVVNISSLAGLAPIPFNALYSATKHALEALSEALAFELEPWDIRVAIVEPGYFRTAIGDNVAAMSDLDPASPYAAAERRALEGAIRSVNNGGDPRLVAATIVEAATTTEPRRHWLVGPDAELIAPARRTSTEAEWSDLVHRFILGPS